MSVKNASPILQLDGDVALLLLSSLCAPFLRLIIIKIFARHRVLKPKMYTINEVNQNRSLIFGANLRHRNIFNIFTAFYVLLRIFLSIQLIQL